MRNQIFHSPGNEEAELAKIPGDGDPPPPHCTEVRSAPLIHFLKLFFYIELPHIFLAIFFPISGATHNISFIISLYIFVQFFLNTV